ncbi:signal transduction histidine kinase [Pseudorhodoferax soli]|uniref:histidine kinase n=2 Tax=Pseudorhodoferax soli TaxID=545864 RepID=A0A368XXK2_9BURK|nr:signal transduction histidine kinase [Pseudorhodoferax soli]
MTPARPWRQRMHTDRVRWLLPLLLALCPLLHCAAAPAADPPLEIAPASADAISLAPHLSVLVDTGRGMTLDDVQQPAAQQRFMPASDRPGALNYGFTDAALWFRLRLRNGSAVALERLLEINFPMLSQVDFHAPSPAGGWDTVSTGAARPFATRAYPSRFFVFPVTLPAHAEQTFYLRVQGHNGIVVPATLWEPAAFRADDRAQDLVQAAYFGLAAALVVYNLLMLVTLRDAVYFWYCVFASAMALTISTVNGFAAEFLWPAASSWAGISFNVLYSLAMAAQVMFIRRTLDLRATAPRIDRAMQVLIGATLSLAGGFLVAPQALTAPVSVVWAMSGLALLAVVAHGAVVRRQRIAALLCIAFSMLLLGGFMIELKTLAVIPHNSFTQQGLQLGSALEMLLLAFTLAYRFHLLRSEATAVVQRSNDALALHLRAKEAELTATHLELRESDRLQTLSQERQRFMQDMHDGVGSSLTTALRVVERGHLDEAAVAQVLKSCIDDLKLAIDSMEPVESDLLLLLATLRFRAGPRLEDSGLQLQWDVQPIAALEWLEPKASLHILRILQEALANIVKHADATRITLATRMQGNEVAVSVRDNGRGFRVPPPLAGATGKGLANQQRRAKDIGASVQLESSGAGTCLTLLLPVDRRQA